MEASPPVPPYSPPDLRVVDPSICQLSSDQLLNDRNDFSMNDSKSIMVDSVQLLREVFRQQAGSSNNGNELPNSSQLKWLIGDDTDPMYIRLLDHIEISRVDQMDNQMDRVEHFQIKFKLFNISVPSDAPTQWVDRQGSRFSVGDLVLFAIQLQSGVINSQQISAVGHLPFSVLMRRPLASILEKGADPRQIAPLSYDTKVLTPVLRTNPLLAIHVETPESLMQIFGISSGAASSLNISIGTISDQKNEKKKNNLMQRLDFRHHVPPREVCPISSNRTSFELPTVLTVESFIHLIELDLMNPKTLLRVNRSFGSDIVQLFDHHLSSKSHHTTSKVTNNSALPVDVKTSPQSRERHKNRHSSPMIKPDPQKSLSVVRVHPYTSTTEQTKARTLWEVLASRKLKPIIVVPSSSSSTLVHLGNCKYFFETKQLPAEQSTSLDDKLVVCQDNFTWTVDVPIRRSTSSSNSVWVSVDIKVCGDSQVTRFQKMDWFRTVAVIVNGPEWQFKHWPFRDYGSLFSCIRGVHFAFESIDVHPFVKKYGVEVLRLKRTTRHSDISAWSEFVKGLGSVLNSPRDFRQFDRNKLKGN